MPTVCGAIASHPSKGPCFPPTASHNSRGVADAPHPCKPALSKPGWIKELHVGCTVLIKTYTSGIKPCCAELPSVVAIHPWPQEFPDKFPCQLFPGSASTGCPKTKSTLSRMLHSLPCASLRHSPVSHYLPGPTFWSHILTQKTADLPLAAPHTCSKWFTPILDHSM